MARRQSKPRRRSRSSPAVASSWCCSFTPPPSSPEPIPRCTELKKQTVIAKPPRHSFSTSAAAADATASPVSARPTGGGPGLVGRILSPGRVSPIDHNPDPKSGRDMYAAPQRDFVPGSPSGGRGMGAEGGEASCGCDVRLSLRGRKGGSLVLEVDSIVLGANSEVFARVIEEHMKGVSSLGGSKRVCSIEAGEVENLGVFRETIELMFEEEIEKKLVKIGAFRCIDILEVATSIKFNRGILSCLRYLEAVPWTEEEEEKLRSLFTRFDFDNATARDILSRLYTLESPRAEVNLARQLVASITECSSTNARNELKPLVKGLLCRSSVYEKDHTNLTKDDLYKICIACIDELINLFEEANGNSSPRDKLPKDEANRPLLERISRQVDNINWVLEILFDWRMAEEFVDLWSAQNRLLELHQTASPMLRYELSRVSASLFIAMGTRRLHCDAEARLGIFESWFRPMLLDFGWLQRCRKGLETKVLEEAMGQTLLTLPLKQQYVHFMEWFRSFSKHGSECPNLSKPLQIWWRRSFLRGSETDAVETR
ncbi:hypothetical protein MLD38_020432 [Melastoma candidum]|uniref:Uncharacterized protein n=1 Tax=Melastoma candidum TaxID=119954 RepID=A0ACB9QGQ4_9MYRT|nr:hypothetical protein MLD38_020432 [Melastoma candidum]